MAICADAAESWYWKLPGALLSIRTTLKPDVGSSPADLVYGEGLALPGDLIGDFVIDDETLRRRRESTLAGLRLEVARLQPKPTSAHRQPRIYVPSELQNASHVFVKRGGVQASLSTPYEGPYRVIARTAAGYKIAFPGGREETVAIARLKPAHIAADDNVDVEQELDDARPPSPRPPGRPPGVRTRIPAATTRVTRQQQRNNPTTSDQPTPGPSSSAAQRPKNRRRGQTRNIDEFQPRASASASHPMPELQVRLQRLREQPPPPIEQRPQPASPNPTLHRTSAESSHQQLADEPEPNEPSFFEFTAPATTRNSVPLPTVSRPPTKPISSESTQPTPAAPSNPQPDCAAAPLPPPTPRRFYSDLQRPDPQRRYFSDRRTDSPIPRSRLRPDVSVIFEHLQPPMPPVP